MLKQIALAIAFMLALNSQAQVQVPNYTVEQLLAEAKTTGDTLVLYNFWATWCRPCVAEMPYFIAVAEQYKDLPFKLVFVSVDFERQKDSKLIPFVETQQIKQPVYLLLGKPAEYIDDISPAWEGSIPASLLVRSSDNVYLFKEQEFTQPELEALVKSLMTP